MMFNNVNNAWVEIVALVLDKGKEVNGTKELNNVKFEIENVENNLVTSREGFSLLYYLGETIWYGAGKNDVEFISKFGKIWEILTDDGIVNNSAYGYILKEKHGFNQIEKMVELLKFDKDSRRAVMNINIPRENVIETRDEMCTIALQFLIRDGKLEATGIMRSNDLSTGTPYDIFYFTEIQKYIAKELNIETGKYTHFATSLHIYNRDIEKMKKSVENHRNGIGSNVIIDGQKLLANSEYLYGMLEKLDRKEIREQTVKICENMGIVKYK